MYVLETFMGLDQRTGAGTNPRIPHVVSKLDRDHGKATTDNRNLGLTPAVTISRSNLSLSLYPIPTTPILMSLIIQNTIKCHHLLGRAGTYGRTLSSVDP